MNASKRRAHRAGLRLHRRLLEQPDWDPNTTAGRRLEDGPLAVGSRFALDVRMGGRIAPMEYRLSDCERPDRVVFVGAGSDVAAVDDIRFERARADGTVIEYIADIRLGGLMRLAQPFLGIGVRADRPGCCPGMAHAWRRWPRAAQAGAA